MLDPFIGSDTTTKAAMQNERNSTGYEIDERLITLSKATTTLDEASNKVTIVTREPV